MHIMLLGHPDILICGGDFMSNNLKSIEASLKKNISKEVNCREWHHSIVLEGRVCDWIDVVRAGKLAANRGYKGVINKLLPKDLIIPEIKKPMLSDNYLHNKKVDVLIIGAGIIGCSIARELSKWNISILLIDKENDVAMHASSRNDGMVHPGIEPKLGSKRSIFNTRGNSMYTQVAKELDVHFERCGSTVLFNKNWVKLAAPIINVRAKKAGVPGVSLLNKEQVKKYEANVQDEIAGAVHFSSTGVLSPYKLTIAYAENAVMNGASISLNTIAKAIKKEQNKITAVETNRGTIYPKAVINAAGIYADHIADMAEDQFFTIHPRKGEIAFLDKKKGKLISGVLAMPELTQTKSNTKGGGLVKTIDGNILVGPDAYEQPFKEDYSTNKSHIDGILKKHLPLLKGISPADVIAYCAGTRASTYEEDFIIEKSEYVENLIYAAGIQSPGLASAPAIAEEIEKLTCEVLSKYITMHRKENWNPIRKGIPDLSHMSFEERSTLIKKRPDYGIIVCRCEEISKGEIIDALSSPIPVNDVDGIKRRVRAGMGRCQGGFCLPSVMDILSETTGLSLCEITKKGNNSYITAAETKLADTYSAASLKGR